MPAFARWVRAAAIWHRVPRDPAAALTPRRRCAPCTRRARSKRFSRSCVEIEALVIRDFYHRYTVDEHTLVAIESVLELRGRKDDTFGDLAAETEDLDLLITALLFHDVGKGTPDEGHVTVSRRIAEQALRRAGHL